MTDETSTPPGEIPVEVAPETKPEASAEAKAAAEADPRDARIASLEQARTALEAEKKDLHDRLLRSVADFDNFRKRTRKEMDDARAKAKEDVVREILPVVDNLERAIAAAGDSGGPVAEGVKLVLRQFASALDRFEVKAFASLGEAFDPTRHEAISQVETADKPAGTVVVEMQKGYTMGPRLVRPAMVAVARPPAPPPEPPSGDAPATSEASAAAEAPASSGEGA